jgi:hypothetical protein
MVATWVEGIVPVREGFHGEPGEPDPQPPDAVLRQIAERPVAEGEFATVLRFAREHRLPSLYDGGGMEFEETAAVHLDHGGMEIGRVLVISRTGDTFAALGWIHPDHESEARAAAHISPGLWIDAAEIIKVAGSDVLHVTRSTFAELSITSAPSRAGTTLEIGRPQRCPSPDWEALHVGPGSVFYAAETDRLRFAAAQGADDRVTFASSAGV